MTESLIPSFLKQFNKLSVSLPNRKEYDLPFILPDQVNWFGIKKKKFYADDDDYKAQSIAQNVAPTLISSKPDNKPAIAQTAPSRPPPPPPPEPTMVKMPEKAPQPTMVKMPEKAPQPIVAQVADVKMPDSKPDLPKQAKTRARSVERTGKKKLQNVTKSPPRPKKHDIPNFEYKPPKIDKRVHTIDDAEKQLELDAMKAQIPPLEPQDDPIQVHVESSPLDDPIVTKPTVKDTVKPKIKNSDKKIKQSQKDRKTIIQNNRTKTIKSETDKPPPLEPNDNIIVTSITAEYPEDKPLRARSRSRSPKRDEKKPKKRTKSSSPVRDVKKSSSSWWTNDMQKELDQILTTLKVKREASQSPQDKKKTEALIKYMEKTPTLGKLKGTLSQRLATRANVIDLSGV